MTGDVVRKLVAVLVFAVALSTLYVTYQNQRPCARPIDYSIGVFNPKFGISRESYVADLKQAAMLWNSAAGKEVIRYVETGGVEVSLVYDERQKAAELGTAIHEAEQSYDREKARVDAVRASFELAQEAYEDKVAYWNARGGAPESVYQDLEAARVTLDARRVSLNADIATLNARVRATNAQVQTYNKNSGQFEQGEYRSDASGARISLYEFTSETQLVRLAAHEFGHALGLDHVAGTNSIMYPENKGTGTALSSEDIAALRALCSLP